MISRTTPPRRIEYKEGKMNLILRPFEADDAQELHRVLKETLPSLYQFMHWEIKEWTLEDCLQWVIERQGEYLLAKS